MKKLTMYQREVLLKWGEAWLDSYQRFVECRKDLNSEEYKQASKDCEMCRTVIEALGQALQVDCSLTEFRFIVSTKKDGELFSWGI